MVIDPLLGGNRADGRQRVLTQLAHAFGDKVGGCDQFGRLFIKQQMIFAKMRTGHMPMEILGLEVERIIIGQQAIQRIGQCFFAIVTMCHGSSPYSGGENLT